MHEAMGLDIQALAAHKTIAPKPWVLSGDSRRAGKPCGQCGVWTFMGTVDNVPMHSRERWDGKRYLRFCGPECESVGWNGR